MALRSYPLVPPRWLRLLYPGLLWRMPARAKEVYLTFDDGPTADITPWVLDQLAHYDAKATFFLIGKNAQAHPGLMEQLRQSPHRLGNHTHEHCNGWKTPLPEYLRQIEQCSRYVESHLFRPPYGRIRHRQIRALQDRWQIVMWDLLSADFDTRLSPEVCTRLVTRNLRPGSVVVFHDSEKAWPRLRETLPAVLAHLQREGYRCCKLPEPR